MYGVIDIGSNTIRLEIYRLTEDGWLLSVMNKKYMTGLAGDTGRDGALTENGIRKAEDALLELKLLLENIRMEKSFPLLPFRSVL